MIRKFKIFTSILTKPLFITYAIFFALYSISSQSLAEEWALQSPAPPVCAYYAIPDANGFVKVTINKDGMFPSEELKVTAKSFWTTEGDRLSVQLHESEKGEYVEDVNVSPGQPIIINTQNIADGKVAWGSLLIEDKNKGKRYLPLALGNFGPSIESCKPVNIPASGKGNIKLDMSRYHVYGNNADFTLTAFRSESHTAKVAFVNNESGISRSVEFSNKNTDISLDIDAGALYPGKIYTGSLQTTIGEHSFIETPVRIKRKDWDGNAEFSFISPARGEKQARLILSTAGEKPIYGITVSTKDDPTDSFDPRQELDVLLKRNSGEISLWTLDSTSVNDVIDHSIHSGSQYEVIVKAKNDDLAPGIHTATLRFSGLNVDPENRIDAHITFEVKKHPAFALTILIIAVLLSYMMSKGFTILLRRRNLRQRIANIKQTSWLRDDRWGAVPIVRAFGRVAMADIAMNGNHGLKWLARVITTPNLIVNEIKSVEKRLETLSRLNNLAIYWKVAPVASGVQVSGVDNMVVRRAQKVLRRIVDRSSQLRDNDDVEPEIIQEIEALEGWRKRDSMEVGYWISLREDIQSLLDSVYVEYFDFDDKKLTNLLTILNAEKNNQSDNALKQILTDAIKKAELVHRDGLQDLRSIFTRSVLSNMTSGVEIDSIIVELEKADREVVRRIVNNLSSTKVPGTLNEMIRIERYYSQLKLIWEHRDHAERKKMIINKISEEAPLEDVFRILDDVIWEILKQDNVVNLVQLNERKTIEEYELIDFNVECTDSNAKTFLFKHGLEFEWSIQYGEDKILVPITRSPTVTQFIPEATKVIVSVTMKYKGDTHCVKEIDFNTVPTTRYKHLWPIPTTEFIGVCISLLLAIIAGFQSKAFSAALLGSYTEYIALFAWGVGADQMRNLVQNIDAFTKGEDAPT